MPRIASSTSTTEYRINLLVATLQNEYPVVMAAYTYRRAIVFRMPRARPTFESTFSTRSPMRTIVSRCV